MTQATILRLLRADAKSWWYHKQLRERGNIAEAIKREHESMRSTIKLMRRQKVDEIDFRHAIVSFVKLENATEYTAWISNVHTNELAAWVYVVANHLGAN